MENLSQRVNQLSDTRAARNLFLVLEGVYERLRCVALNTAGLAIKGAASAIVKTGAADQYLIVQGKLVKVTAATDMPALAGTVLTATANVFVFSIDNAGNKFTSMGTAGTTLATMKWPAFAKTRAVIGAIIVFPTGTGSFVGGTTALDDVTVVPAVVYLNPLGAFDPTALVG